MNIHSMSFEQLLGICSSIDDPEEMSALIQALDLLERNVRYLRKGLEGKLAQRELQDRETREKERNVLKQSLRLVTPGDGERGNGEEDA